MALPPSTSALGGSHGDLPALPGICTEAIDVSGLAVGNVEPSQLTLESTLNFGDEIQESSKPAATASTKLSKMPVLVDKRVYLDVSHAEKFVCEPGQEIYGLIVECPRKANGNHYKMDWQAFKEDLPIGLDPVCLREYLPKSKEMKAWLLEGVEKFQEEERLGLAPKSKKGQNKNASKKRPAKAAPALPSTPPPAVRFAKRAALMTAADSTSVSSLSGRTFASGSTIPTVTTGSVGSRTRPPTRRATLEDDSDSDEDVDNFQPLENAYYTIETEDDFYCSPLDQDSDSDLEEDPEESISKNATGNLAELVSNLMWKFEEVEKGAIDKPHKMYEGLAGLRAGIAECFTDPSECLEECGGLTYKFVARLAANSNDYFKFFIEPGLCKNKRFHNIKWVDITTAEMYHFLGIILKISLAEMDAGGYVAYFSPGNRLIHTGWCRGSYKTKELEGTKGFASDIMSLSRFKQIRAAFHPENKIAGNGGDKCYQLRYALNCLNHASLRTFAPGCYLTFDEGGVACRSRMCPVRQYNKDKPDKYRVDFFVLADAKTYAILHMDVYQGRNADNTFIDDRAAELPTTQKAVLNAIYQCKLETETSGYRHLAMDNRYQCPELAVILRDRCRIMNTGTTRRNRKGFDNEQLNLPKQGDRGEYKILYDMVNEVLTFQWRDSKVVNCVSTIRSSVVESVMRQVGSSKILVQVPAVMKVYQQTMFGVDKGDQMRLHGGGFARKAHFKKWYKKSFFAVLDCMLLNGLIAWNHATENQPELKRA